MPLRSDPQAWWNLPGVVGAYQSIAAPDPQRALYNAPNPERFKLNTGGLDAMPAWSSSRGGWDFSASPGGVGSHLRTGIVPNEVMPYSGNYCPMTWICRYSNLNGTDRQFLFGAGGRSGGGNGMWLWAVYSDSTIMRSANHFLKDLGWLGVAGGFQSYGVFAMVGQYIYFYNPAVGFRGPFLAGASNSGSITTFDFRFADDATNNYDGKMRIQGAAIYRTVLSRSAVFSAMRQLYYCEKNPDWSVWGRRRKWYYAPLLTAGRVGFYRARPTIALPGGVSIRSVGDL